MQPGIVSERLPGPRSAELAQQKEQYVARGYGNACQMVARRAEGALIEDLDGNVFIDFAGGIGSLNVGHCSPPVVEAIKNQIDSYFHTGHALLMAPYIQLARKLCQITPGGFSKKALLLNSGAEAIENTVKFARRYTRRTGVLSLHCGFHGRTFMAMTLTSKVRPYKFSFLPLCPDVYKVNTAYCYRCPYQSTYPDCGLHCLEELEYFFASEFAAENVAAIVVEPVQGEGGFIVLPPEYLRGLRQMSEKYGFLFVADEIQTGFARTGKMFACEHFGIEPDLMALAKSLGAGLPISAVVGRQEIMDAPEKGEVGSTFGGSPLGCAAALAVIDLLEKENLAARAAVIGEITYRRLQEMQDKYEIIGDVRGLGAMNGIELVKDRRSKEPAREETARIIAGCYQRGLTILKAGIYDNVIRILVPLVISEEHLLQGLSILEESIAESGKC
ncbi:MAG: 4-aminobutyrate--2-oxoglutarate transaminase [Syntrophomonadaceae bacterium]|nr:4-aminobutyrate--2-oxoglutarate transaminase [Syntrophomonadaceae bacterium]